MPKALGREFFDPLRRAQRFHFQPQVALDVVLGGAVALHLLEAVTCRNSSKCCHAENNHPHQHDADAEATATVPQPPLIDLAHNLLFGSP